MATYHIVLRSGDEEIHIAPDGDVRLLENGAEGLGRIEALTILENYAYCGGGYPTARHMEPREIRLCAEIAHAPESAQCAALRRKLFRLMNPNEDVEMTVRMGGEERVITLLPSGESSAERSHLLAPVEIELSFIAPDPCFRAVRAEEISFWQATPIWAFPLNMMAGAGTVSGYYGTTNAARLHNPGDRECGYRLLLSAENGSVVRPRVILPDGVLQLTCTLADGETAEIDTNPLLKKIRVNGVSSMCFTADSIFAPIPRGTSTITLSADEGIAYLHASLSYTPLYYGI